MNAFKLRTVAVPPLAEAKRHGPDDRFVQVRSLVDPRRFQQVSGDVFENQLAVRDIGIERADQVIAVERRPLGGVIPFVAMSIGIVDHVHPVPGPAPAKRGCKQPIDQGLIGPRRSIVQELLDLLGPRRQAGQAEAETPDQGRRSALAAA